MRRDRISHGVRTVIMLEYSTGLTETSNHCEFSVNLLNEHKGANSITEFHYLPN